MAHAPAYRFVDRVKQHRYFVGEIDIVSFVMQVYETTPLDGFPVFYWKARHQAIERPKALIASARVNVDGCIKCNLCAFSISRRDASGK